MRDDKPVNRRRFFREGLRELLRPVAELVQPLEDAINQFSQLESTPETPKPRVGFLRPPGALEERQFLQTCSRCSKCVDVCPAQCIKIEPGKAGGAPYIDANVMPCVVCDGLLCMRECPSGALVPTALGLIEMGTAKWDSSTCVRLRGENCTICIDQCPLGTAAITLTGGCVDVIEDGCIGCGVCQHYCPTSPKSIVVVPRTT